MWLSSEPKLPSAFASPVLLVLVAWGGLCLDRRVRDSSFAASVIELCVGFGLLALTILWERRTDLERWVRFHRRPAVRGRITCVLGVDERAIRVGGDGLCGLEVGQFLVGTEEGEVVLEGVMHLQCPDGHAEDVLEGDAVEFVGGDVVGMLSLVRPTPGDLGYRAHRQVPVRAGTRDNPILLRKA
jgi:hypothetical protein